MSRSEFAAWVLAVFGWSTAANFLFAYLYRGKLLRNAWAREDQYRQMIADVVNARRWVSSINRC